MTTIFIHNNQEFEFSDNPVDTSKDDELLLVEHDDSSERRKMFFCIQSCGCLWRTFYEQNKQGGFVQTWHRVRHCKKALQLIAEDKQVKDIMK